MILNQDYVERKRKIQQFISLLNRRLFRAFTCSACTEPEAVAREREFSEFLLLSPGGARVRWGKGREGGEGVAAAPENSFFNL